MQYVLAGLMVVAFIIFAIALKFGIVFGITYCILWAFGMDEVTYPADFPYNLAVSISFIMGLLGLLFVGSGQKN